MVHLQKSLIATVQWRLRDCADIVYDFRLEDYIPYLSSSPQTIYSSELGGCRCTLVFVFYKYFQMDCKIVRSLEKFKYQKTNSVNGERCFGRQLIGSRKVPIFYSCFWVKPRYFRNEPQNKHRLFKSLLPKINSLFWRHRL